MQHEHALVRNSEGLGFVVGKMLLWTCYSPWKRCWIPVFMELIEQKDGVKVFWGEKDCALANGWKTNRNHILWKVFFVRAGHLLILEAHMSSCWLINRDICWLFALTELPSGVMKSIRDWVTRQHLSTNVHSNHAQNAQHLSHVVVNSHHILSFFFFFLH